MADIAAKFLALATLALGLLGLFSLNHIYQIDLAQQANATIMVCNTAICFSLLSVALLLPVRAGKLRKILQPILGGAVFCLAAIVLFQDIAGVSLGIDQLFAAATASDANPHPGRMAPPTSASFMLAGAALVMLPRRRGYAANVVMQIGILAILCLALLGLSASLMHIELLFNQLKFASMAANTGIGLLALAGSLWLTWLRQETRHGAYFEREDRRIGVTGIVIILIVAISAGMAGFGILARQLQLTLEAGLRETYDTHADLILSGIERGIATAQPVTTRILLNRYLSDLDANPDNAAARDVVQQDASSFISDTITAVAIYDLAGHLVAQAGHMSDKPELAQPLNIHIPGTQAALLWTTQPVLHTTMDIAPDGKKIGSAIVEIELPYIAKLLSTPDMLGKTAETRVCFPVSDEKMQCLPSIHAPQVSHDLARRDGNNISSMDFALRGKTGTRLALDYRQHHVITAYGPMGTLGGGVVVKVDTAEFYEPIRAKLVYVLLMLAAMATAGIILQRLQLLPLVERLVKSEQRIKTIMANVADGILTINEQGVIESVNPAVCSMFEYPQHELVGQNVRKLFPERIRDTYMEGTGRFLGGRRPEVSGKGTVETCGVAGNGREFTMLLTVSEMYLSGERFFVGCMRDITERKRLETMKSEFVSTVSHELRTPLTSIRGSLSLVIAGVGGVLPPKAKELIEIGAKNCERLILLINDILDIEKIESGEMKFDLQWVELAPLLKQAIDLNRPYAEKFGIGLVALPEFPDAQVRVDEARFMQVMSNLLSNAAKFSPVGADVEVMAETKRDRIHISIIDHGPGIPEEFQSRIFGKFAQADSSETKAKGGTGLGLNISKGIVEHMGGELSFRSRMGHGTVFVIDLPILPQQPLLSSQQDGADAARRVLICEDDPHVAQVLKQLVERQGLTVDVAFTARQASDLLSRYRYAVMTTDLALPDKDGMTLIRELRSNNATEEMPIIVISAKAEEEREELNCSALHVMDWIAKPIDADRLQTAIRQVTHGNAAPRVLHLEDDTDIAQIIALRLNGVARIVHAPTLAAAKQILKNEPIDLVLLDISLPDGSGLSLLDELKRDGKPPIPVIIFSASEVTPEISKKVTLALVKSRTSEDEIAAYILSLAKQRQ